MKNAHPQNRLKVMIGLIIILLLMGAPILAYAGILSGLARLFGGG